MSQQPEFHLLKMAAFASCVLDFLLNVYHESHLDEISQRVKMSQDPTNDAYALLLLLETMCFSIPEAGEHEWEGVTPLSPCLHKFPFANCLVEWWIRRTFWSNSLHLP